MEPIDFSALQVELCCRAAGRRCRQFMQVGGAGAEDGDLRASSARLPERVQVGVGGVAVEQDGRGAEEQAADDVVPHHPAGGREPEQAVAGRAGRCAGPGSWCARGRCRRGCGPAPWAGPSCPRSRATHSGWSKGSSSKTSGGGLSTRSSVHDVQAPMWQRSDRRRVASSDGLVLGSR